MIALLAGILLLGTSAVCAAALLRPAGRVAFVLAAGVLACAEIVVVSHGLSLVDAYERGWFLAALAAIALVAAAAFAAIRPPVPSFRCGDVVRELAGDRLLLVLGAIVLAELGYLFALAVFTPPNDFDSLTYHLTRAIFWIQQESISPTGDAADARIDEYQPDGSILQGATMLLSGSLRWVGLVQLTALVAAMLAIYAIAGRIGLDRRRAAFGALLFATLPVVALQAPSALTDVVVAAFAAAATVFVLGRRPGEHVAAGVTVALLVGTKITGLLLLPLLVAVAVLTHRRLRLASLVGLGALGTALGAAWLAVNVTEGEGPLGSEGHNARGNPGILWITSRATRYAVETVELPGASGRDRFLYLGAAVIVAAVAVALGHVWIGVAAAGLTVLPLAALPLERVLHDAYWRGWELVGFEKATDLGSGRDPTIASNIQSWYGPVGLVLALVALVLVVQAVARGRLPRAAAVLVFAPVAILVENAVATGYHAYSGRYVMGGVALSAATWGLIRPARAGAVAAVAVGATTVTLALVNSAEKPAGVDLLERPGRASVWSLEREWVQNLQPELAVVTRFVDEHVSDGATIAVSRLPRVRPAVYVGYPDIVHRVVYADTLAEAAGRGADWAVLPRSVRCTAGWRRALDSRPWGVYRRSPGAVCPGR